MTTPRDRLYSLFDAEFAEARRRGWDDCMAAIVSPITSWLNLQPDTKRQARVRSWALTTIRRECERRGHAVPPWAREALVDRG